MIQHIKTATRWRSIFLFAVVFLILLTYSLLFQGIPSGSGQPYDAGGYMQLSYTFVQDDSFALTHYPASIRGYLFPLLLYSVRCLLPFASANLCVLILNCAAIAAFLTWTASKTFPSQTRRIVPYIAFLLLLLLFWDDLLPYALTDFHAFWWLLAAVLLWENRRRCEISTAVQCLTGFLCGLLTYAAYNLRPNLSFSLLAFFVWMIVCLVRDRRKFSLFFLMMLAGMLTAAAPQMIINAFHTGSASPAVPTESFDGQGLTLYYLNNGLTMRRYETYAGDPDLFHRSTMIFSNDSMLRLLKTDGISAFSSLSDYILFVVRHPFECVAVYAEHLINLLTPVFGQIFVTDFYGLKVPRILINFGLFAAGTADWLLRTQKKQQPLAAMHRKGLLLPVLIQFVSILPVIAGKVETRYALAVYVFLYLYICWHVNWKQLFSAMRRHPWLTAFILCASLCVYFTILSVTFASFDGPLMRLL